MPSIFTLYLLLVASASHKDGNDYIADNVAINKKVCPPCCKDQEDGERKDWMIKKLFLNNLRVQHISSISSFSRISSISASAYQQHQRISSISSISTISTSAV